MGMFSQSITEEFAKAMLAKHDAMGLTTTEADELVHDLLNEMDELSVHCMLDWVDVWAQRPPL